MNKKEQLLSKLYTLRAGLSAISVMKDNREKCLIAAQKANGEALELNPKIKELTIAINERENWFTRHGKNLQGYKNMASESKQLNIMFNFSERMNFLNAQKSVMKNALQELNTFEQNPKSQKLKKQDYLLPKFEDAFKVIENIETLLYNGEKLPNSSDYLNALSHLQSGELSYYGLENLAKENVAYTKEQIVDAYNKKGEGYLTTPKLKAYIKKCCIKLAKKNSRDYILHYLNVISMLICKTECTNVCLENLSNKYDLWINSDDANTKQATVALQKAQDKLNKVLSEQDIYTEREKLLKKEADALIKNADNLYSVLYNNFNEVLPYNKWESLDKVIYYINSGYADTTKEALNLVLRQEQNDQIILAINEGINSLQSSINAGFLAISQQLYNVEAKQDEMNTALNTLSYKVGSISSKIDFYNSLQEKSNQTSAKLLSDLNFMRGLVTNTQIIN